MIIKSPGPKTCGVNCPELSQGCKTHCPLGYDHERATSELCPICNKPLYGNDKTLTSMEDERTVHLGCLIEEPCDCPHEKDGCHFSGYCEHRKAPDKDLNGTWLPTCGLKFPDKKDGV